jgi:hypothetical protein
MLDVIDPQQPTSTITHRVVSCLRRLFSLRLAGIAAGLPAGRAEAWFDRGQRGESGFAHFYREVAEAQAEWRAVEDELDGIIEGVRERARRGDPTAVLWLTEYLSVPA